MACIEDIIKAASGVLTRGEVLALEKELARRAKFYSGADSLDKFLAGEAVDIVKNIKKAALIEKRNRGINILVGKRILDFVEEFDGPPSQGLEAYMVGIVGHQAGARKNVGARQKAIEGELLGDMISQIRKKDLLKLLNSRELDLDIAKEMWSLHKGEGSVTGNKQAFEMAEIFHRTQRAGVQMQNDLGAFIEPIPGYIVRQGHDSTKIRRAGLEKYVADISKLIDEDLTLKGQDGGEFYAQVYVNLVNGIHFKAEGGGADFLGFRGPSNIAKKASQERVLHFKDAESWHKYNEMYGTGNLTESMFFGIKRAADNAGLMEGFGTNPEAMMSNIIQKLQKKHEFDTDEVRKLGGKRFKWFMSELDGSINSPGSVRYASYAAGYRALQTMALLGKILLASFNDIVTQAAALKSNNVGFFDSYAQSFKSILEGRRKGEQREIADSLNLGMDGMMGQVLSRFTAQDLIPGAMSKTLQRFFKLTGLNWWTDAHKTGAGLMLSNNLAKNRSLKWGDLNEKFRTKLGLYFDEKSWDLIRESGVREAEGRSFITPDAIKEIPDSELISKFGEMSERKLRIKRMEIETDLRSYIVDQTDTAILTPDSKIRAITKGGTNPGEHTGEALRFFWQFKSFPLTFGSRGIGQFFPENKDFLAQLVNGKADVAGLMHLILASTAMGYVSLSAVDAFNNRTPRPTDDPKTWAAAFLKGGGLALYGDLIFGQASQYGRSALQGFMGPTFGNASGAIDMVHTLIGSDVKDRAEKLERQAVRLARNHIPLQNLFYSKWATDWLLFDGISEAINPGYKDRVRRIIEKNGQNLIIGGN